MPKTFNTARSSFIFLAGLIVVGVVKFGLMLIAPSTDKKWSAPILITHVEESSSSFAVHLWNNKPIGSQSGKKFYFLGENGHWLEKISPQLKDVTFYPLAIDPRGADAFFCQLEYTNKKAPAIQTLLKVKLNPQGGIELEKRILLDAIVGNAFKVLNSRSNFHQEISVGCGPGFVSGSEAYIPYDVQIQNVVERITSTGTHQTGYSDGGGKYGLLRSEDGGTSWEMLPLDDKEVYTLVRRTNSRRYLFTLQKQRELSVSIQPTDSSAWSRPQLLCDSVRNNFLAVPEIDTVHLCWMDTRLKKGIGFFIYGDWDVGRRNNQVFYRNLQDGNAVGVKERKLSGSLSYCGAPTMSVEGKKIVVAWEHYLKPYTRAAIYYVTSTNNGRTWSRIHRVETFSQTTAEAPVVVLHKGIIHLFYDRTEWPNRRCDLMHQQRQFPD